MAKELDEHVERTRRVRRRPQRRTSVPNGPGRIPALTRIADRPPQMLDRTTAGHWEGDLLVGRYGRSHLVTLVERHSRYLLVLPLPDARSSSVVATLIGAFAQLPAGMGRSDADLGPRHRDDPPSGVHRGERRAGVLLRCLLPLAAREQREHQRAAAAVLPEEDRPLTDHERHVDQRRRRTQSATTTSARVAESARGLQPCRRCDDCLRALPTRGQFSRAADRCATVINSILPLRVHLLSLAASSTQGRR
jgi:hypothetical protein